MEELLRVVQFQGYRTTQEAGAGSHLQSGEVRLDAACVVALALSRRDVRVGCLLGLL